MTKISVCIPAFNAEKYITETLLSISEQTVLPFEVLVCDDCSTDNTTQIVKNISKTYPIPLRLISNWKNMGIGYTRQNLVNYAEGNYIAFLSADDCYIEDFVEETLRFLKPNQATFTAYYRCNEKLEIKQQFNPPQPTYQSIIDWALKKNMFINFSSVVIPKSYLKTIPFETSLRHGEDLIWLLDSILSGLTWELIPAPLLAYRIHPQQGTNLKSYKSGEEFNLLWQMLTQRLTNLRVPKDVVDEAKYQSFKNANPSKCRIIVSKLYHKVKGI